MLTFGEADTVTELVVMVRPGPAALALGEGIMSHLARDLDFRPD